MAYRLLLRWLGGIFDGKQKIKRKIVAIHTLVVAAMVYLIAFPKLLEMAEAYGGLTEFLVVLSVPLAMSLGPWISMLAMGIGEDVIKALEERPKGD
jgi:hypothetical protein